MYLLTISVLRCGHTISYSYTSVFGRIGVDFNDDFSPGVFDQKQMPLPKFTAEPKIMYVEFRNV